MAILGWRCSVVLAAAIVAGTSVVPAADPPSAATLKALRSDVLDVRRDAANRLRAADPATRREALPVLIDLLKSEKDGQVRLGVLDALLAMGADAAPAVDALVLTLRTDYGGLAKEELHQDYRSALALAAIGKPAVSGLRSLLAQQKENVRAEALMALGRIGPDAAPAVPDLIPLLGSESDRIGRETATALGRIGKAAAGPLIAACASSDPTVRGRAVRALGGASPSDPIVAAVIERAGDPSPKVRGEAIAALGRFGLADDTLRPVVAKMLGDEDGTVRVEVVTLLSDRKALRAGLASTLDILLAAKDEGVARDAAFLLGAIGPEAAPRLIDALGREASRPGPIAEALAGMGRAIAPRLDAALGSSDPRVRGGAALALGQVRPVAPGTIHRLTAGLTDPSPAVQRAFLAAILGLGPRAAEAVPSVRAKLDDPSPEVRLQVVSILAQAVTPDARLLADLGRKVDDPDVRVQRLAIDVLRSFGPAGRGALAAVIRKLDSPDTAVRLAAAESIGGHGQAAASAVPALARLLADRSPRIRTVAAQALETLGPAARPAFDALKPLLRDENPEVREAVALALAGLELDPETIRPHLAPLLVDTKLEVRRASMRAIGRLGPGGVVFVPDLIRLAANKDTARSADRMLRPFERTGPDARSLPELLKLAETGPEPVRLLALKFLGLAGRDASGVVPALERLKSDPSEPIRKQTDAAIGQIKSDTGADRQRKRIYNPNGADAAN